MSSVDYEPQPPDRRYLHYLLRARISRRRMTTGLVLTGGILALSLVKPELVPSCYPKDDQIKSEEVSFFQPGSFLCSLQNPLIRLEAAILSLGLAAVSVVARRSAVSYLRDELDKFE